MMTPEETRVLAFLRRRLTAPAADVARACLADTSPEWLDRVIANLNWFGYVTVYPGRGGGQAFLQITNRGRSCPDR